MSQLQTVHSVHCNDLVNAASIRWWDVIGTLYDKQMPTYLESKIYQTMVCPVALYGAECWPLTKSLESHLSVMEMSMLRQSAGISHLEHITTEDVQDASGWNPSLRSCGSSAYSGMSTWCMLTQILLKMLCIHYK